MQQIQSTISRKYQVVIPSVIRKRLNLRAGQVIIWYVIPTKTTPKAVAEAKPASWTKQMLGLGKDIWQEVDIETYIKNLRSEWEVQK